ncbi:hypothetical protein ACIG63_14865 [Streptomyces antimycoticus]|uniref:hypothetical protein n=1 Tax=Streptomyces antimycoticus TaxID=68175 RepID=UPI0037D8C3D2
MRVVGPGVPLTDAQWARIEPLLPDRTPKRGGRWRDHRKLVDANRVQVPDRHAVGLVRAHQHAAGARKRGPGRRTGRPRHRPVPRRTDREIRNHLRRRGIRAVIPERADQQANRRQRGRTGGRPPVFDRETYKQRNTVERCINRLKRWRGIATRYEKTATVYLAGLHIAGIFLWSER